MTRLLIIAALIVGFAAAFVSQRPAATESAAAQPGDGARAPAKRRAASGDESGALVLRRDSSGQFHMTAQVNGEDVRFMIDTGADVVALTVEDAQRLGLEAEPDEFEAVGRTASGVGYGKAVRLDRIEIDGHEMENVEAVVMDGLATNLLGQSVLRRLGRLEMRGDTMLLHAGG